MELLMVFLSLDQVAPNLLVLAEPNKSNLEYHYLLLCSADAERVHCAVSIHNITIDTHTTIQQR
jgi:hypothetical protein